jgi:hypothetical protein
LDRIKATIPASGAVIATSLAPVDANDITDCSMRKLLTSEAVRTDAAVKFLNPLPMRVS